MSERSLPHYLAEFIRTIEETRRESLQTSLEDFARQAPLLRRELDFHFGRTGAEQGERDFIKEQIRQALDLLRKRVHNPEAINQLADSLGFKRVPMEYVELDPPTSDELPYLELSPGMSTNQVLAWLTAHQLGKTLDSDSISNLLSLVSDAQLNLRIQLAEELSEHIQSPYRGKPVYITLVMDQMAFFLRALWESPVVNKTRTKRRQFIRAFASILQNEKATKRLNASNLEDKVFEDLEATRPKKTGWKRHLSSVKHLLEGMTLYLTKADTKGGLFHKGQE